MTLLSPGTLLCYIKHQQSDHKSHKGPCISSLLVWVMLLKKINEFSSNPISTKLQLKGQQKKASFHFEQKQAQERILGTN